MAEKVSHLIFDVESIADGDLISAVRYGGQGLTAEQAIATYQDELVELNGTTFIPHTYQIPISVVIAKIASDFRLIDIVSLDEPEFRPHVITEHFWRGWELYGKPQWVTFNGRSFDLPVMELAAFRFGISIGPWFKSDGYRSPRNRFSTDAHLDLQELLTNFGAARCNGGLNLVSKLINKPGKMDVTGDQVQKQADEGQYKAISDYCRCDVLDTYFVFLRAMVMMGKTTLEKEIQLVEQTRLWIEERAESCDAYAAYLNAWTEWNSPWPQKQDPPAEESKDSA
ncbi:3'-5' exonuclease [Novipirellula artificiosorum]|uniref:Putative 3'-5' exonuclease related to the exonuclease domain of PolB n=1 Tax=Novipirellula artificiosorum TaxID=2528016 RepID=A0A5C6DVH9_9BACT|nr:3'-5' exonuclease [Novipirellula artificiosorum]TWU40700.1 putative 3'-5' exonuclease related to the exonuclease domain of PolB [Novipirellula artificiosorum]